MTRWRQRIGEKVVEKLLQITIGAGKKTRTITERSLDKVIVGTTIQPKAIQQPTVGHGLVYRSHEREPSQSVL